MLQQYSIFEKLSKFRDEYYDMNMKGYNVYHYKILKLHKPKGITHI